MVTGRTAPRGMRTVVMSAYQSDHILSVGAHKTFQRRMIRAQYSGFCDANAFARRGERNGNLSDSHCAFVALLAPWSVKDSTSPVRRPVAKSAHVRTLRRCTIQRYTHTPCVGHALVRASCVAATIVCRRSRFLAPDRGPSRHLDAPRRSDKPAILRALRTRRMNEGMCATPNDHDHDGHRWP